MQLPAVALWQHRQKCVENSVVGLRRQQATNENGNNPCRKVPKIQAGRTSNDRHRQISAMVARAQKCLFGGNCPVVAARPGEFGLRCIFSACNGVRLLNPY